MLNLLCVQAFFESPRDIYCNRVQIFFSDQARTFFLDVLDLWDKESAIKYFLPVVCPEKLEKYSYYVDTAIVQHILVRCSVLQQARND